MLSAKRLFQNLARKPIEKSRPIRVEQEGVLARPAVHFAGVGVPLQKAGVPLPQRQFAGPSDDLPVAGTQGAWPETDVRFAAPDTRSEPVFSLNSQPRVCA
jgi:hypothetical protein